MVIFHSYVQSASCAKSPSIPRLELCLAARGLATEEAPSAPLPVPGGDTGARMS